MLEEVDWIGSFTSFYEVISVKFLCRDPELIPSRLPFEVNKKFYKMLISVEPPSTADLSGGDDPPPDQGDGTASQKESTKMDEEEATLPKEPAENCGDSNRGGITISGTARKLPLICSKEMVTSLTSPPSQSTWRKRDRTF